MSMPPGLSGSEKDRQAGPGDYAVTGTVLHLLVDRTKTSHDPSEITKSVELFHRRLDRQAI